MGISRNSQRIRDVHPMLTFTQRRRRLANIVPTIAERSAFAGLHWMPVAPPHRHVKKVIDSNVEKIRNPQTTSLRVWLYRATISSRVQPF